MGVGPLDAVTVTELRRIPVEGGDVLHALRRDAPGFAGFGEAYFSWVRLGAIKAWKRHTRMTLNLVVPVGAVKFVFVSPDDGVVRTEVIGERRYARLTVPPGIWFGFTGLVESGSLVLNVADIPHDPLEVERADLSAFAYDWSEESRSDD